MFNLKNSLVLVSSLSILVACNGGGGVGGGTVGGGGGGGTVGGGGGGLSNYQNPSITVSQFVDSLNYVDNVSSYVELYTDETLRSQIPGEEDWFVIWDDLYGEYKAVSLQYIRAIVYVDYYASNDSLAEEFRQIELDDIANGDLYGDYWGDDYEVVDYDPYTDVFVGVNSGFEYEDETSSTDVSLLAAEETQKAFFQRAANVSVAYNVSIETSLSLVTLGQKAEAMLGQNSGELTVADQTAFAADLQNLAGVTAADVMAAANSQAGQSQLVSKIASKIGTSAANLENRILPELFGVEL